MMNHPLISILILLMNLSFSSNASDPGLLIKKKIDILFDDNIDPQSATSALEVTDLLTDVVMTNQRPSYVYGMELIITARDLRELFNSFSHIKCERNNIDYLANIIDNYIHYPNLKNFIFRYKENVRISCINHLVNRLDSLTFTDVLPKAFDKIDVSLETLIDHPHSELRFETLNALTQYLFSEGFDRKLPWERWYGFEYRISNYLARTTSRFCSRNGRLNVWNLITSIRRLFKVEDIMDPRITEREDKLRHAMICTVFAHINFEIMFDEHVARVYRIDELYNIIFKSNDLDSVEVSFFLRAMRRYNQNLIKGSQREFAIAKEAAKSIELPMTDTHECSREYINKIILCSRDNNYEYLKEYCSLVLPWSLSSCFYRRYQSIKRVFSEPTITLMRIIIQRMKTGREIEDKQMISKDILRENLISYIQNTFNSRSVESFLILHNESCKIYMIYARQVLEKLSDIAGDHGNDIWLIGADQKEFFNSIDLCNILVEIRARNLNFSVY